MSGLSTHVLDQTTGRPAAGVALKVYQDGALLSETSTNEDGRGTDLQGESVSLSPGHYRFEFAIGAYFAKSGAVDGAAAFLDIVPIEFLIAPGMARCHVPLLVTPFAYSTYRGS